MFNIRTQRHQNSSRGWAIFTQYMILGLVTLAVVFTPNELLNFTVSIALAESGTKLPVSSHESKSALAATDISSTLVASSQIPKPTSPIENKEGSAKSEATTWCWNTQTGCLNTVVQWVFDKFIPMVASEAVGFLVLGLVGVWFFRQHVKGAIIDGSKEIGKEISQTFVAYVVPEIIRLREKAEKLMDGTAPWRYGDGTKASKEVEGELLKVEDFKKAQKFEEAAETLRKLQQRFPEELKILNEIYFLHVNRTWKKERNEIEALKLVVAAEESFKANAEYYALLAEAYIRAKDCIAYQHARKGALDAAQKCLSLDHDNPMRKTLLGFIYYSFNEISLAILETKEALAMAERNNKSENEAHIKSNLAYYYAIGAAPENKELSLRYANEAYNFDKEKESKNRFNSLDTLGYVKMKYGTTAKDFEEACNLFQEAVNAVPDDEDFLAHLTEAKRLKDSLSSI